ncbi:hypothetical protein N7475_010082 [Penicillium sp. IBT 31633x]|nr:hypothetical protein N7475_010082 [Penicillium sp. IBT 31633x]
MYAFGLTAGCLIRSGEGFSWYARGPVYRNPGISLESSEFLKFVELRLLALAYDRRLESEIEAREYALQATARVAADDRAPRKRNEANLEGVQESE